MVRARALIRRCLTPAVAVGLLGGLVALVPAAPAAAASAITVTPSTNLVQGQTVSVSGTGYPANSTVGIIECGAGAQTAFDCELRYNTAPTDASGAFSNASFVVNQVINSGNLGILNCAVDSCIIAVGTLDQQNIAVQPITMTNTLGPPDATATLDARFVVDAGGRVTASADVACNVTKDVGLRFTVTQGARQDTGGVAFPCTAGTTVHAIADYVGTGYAPGSLGVVGTIWTGPYPVTTKGTVTLQSQADAQAELAAELSGPNGSRAFAEFVDDLVFRLRYDRVFAHEFFVAILQQLAAG